MVFPRLRIAVFVDGCFWHSCPEHVPEPRRNVEYWVAKLAANQVRDAETTNSLTAAGWFVLRFWEHEEAASVADQISTIVRDRREKQQHARSHARRRADTNSPNDA